MSSSVPSAKVHAKILLQTMCNFILPLVQAAGGQTTEDVKEILLGTEAGEFVAALENFISDIMLSRSQPASKDTDIKVVLPDSFDYLEGTNWLWDMPVPDENADGGSNDDEIQDRISGDQSSMPTPLTGSSSVHRNPVFEDDPVLKNVLQMLRTHITQKLPIRLLCFRPHNSKLNISLLERADIYNYLAPKFETAFRESRKRQSSSWHRDWISKHAGYAILSHTWTQIPGESELTYGDWRQGSLDAEQPRCSKFINFCKSAWADHGLSLGWIDSICINKESSAELDESIRSMYAWYSTAAVCITYLARTERLPDMPHDPWFSRGWTFQEMVAPQNIKFYNMRWEQLIESSENDKENPSILESIQSATTITAVELRDIRNTSISRRMQLTARRQVTRPEDLAYSLMGIFNVSISTAYGEGSERAFFRLVKEIFDSTKNVSDIFNWGGSYPYPPSTPITSLFPSSPSDYLNRSSNTQLHLWRPIKPLTLTHLGLRTQILLMPALSNSDITIGHQPIGDYYATVSIGISHKQSDDVLLRYWGILETYQLLSKTVSQPDSEDSRTRMIWAFGTLNVEAHGDGARIHTSKACFAVLLQKRDNSTAVDLTSSGGYAKIYTKRPIIFTLNKRRNNSDDDESKNYYQIEKSELASHGMQLVTLYL